MASRVDEERSTRGRWRPTRIAIVVAVVVAVGLIGYAGLHDTLQNSNARTELSNYLDDVQRGDDGRAYDRLCAKVLTGYTEADHARFLKAQPAFSAYDLDNPTTTTTSNGTTEITFSVRFTDANGGLRLVRMAVDLQSDGPKVCDGPNQRQGN